MTEPTLSEQSIAAAETRRAAVAAILAELPPTGRRVPGENGRAVFAFIYNRSSELRGRLGGAPEAQSDRNTRAVERKGWTIGGTFTEPDSAPAGPDSKPREEWAAVNAGMAKVAANPNVDVVAVVERTDRADRAVKLRVATLDVFAELGIFLHVTEDDVTFDPRYYRDKAELVKRGADDEAGRERIRTDVNASGAAMAGRGQPHGRVLYGYRREYNERTHAYLRQLPHPEEADVVREVFRRVSAGETLRSICLLLERRGVPVAYRRDEAKRRHQDRPPQWDTPRLHQMIRNPAYKGVLVYKGKAVGRGEWEPLVSDELWADANLVLDNPGRRTNGSNLTDTHLLSGVTFCAVCGGFLRKVLQHGKTRVRNSDGTFAKRPDGTQIWERRSSQYVYQCRGRGGNDTSRRYCTTVDAGDFEDYIGDQVIARLSRPDAARLFAADRQGEYDRVTAEIATAETELDEAYVLRETGELSVRGLAATERRLIPKIAELTAQLPALLPSLIADAAGPDAEAKWKGTGDWAGKGWSLSQKKTIIAAIVDIRLCPVPPADRRLGRRRPTDRDARLAMVARRTEITWRTP